MQLHHIYIKKTHIIFILFYIGAFSMLLTGIRLFCAGQATETPEQIQENIADSIIRLHVIANSDTDADQKLKLAVRDEIITSLQASLQTAKTPDQAADVLLSQLSHIETAASRVLSRYHSNNPVCVSLSPRYFPVKQYGDLTFPAGVYQALCVEIGEAKGRNWWCVLFPSLCFVNETTATVPDASKERLQESLSEEEYRMISENNASDISSSLPTENPTPAETRPELRFGIAEWFLH